MHRPSWTAGSSVRSVASGVLPVLLVALAALLAYWLVFGSDRQERHRNTNPMIMVPFHRQ